MLSRYVRDLGAISLERAVAQASAAAANDILAVDRGRIAVGLPADVIVFDYENLTDRATFAEPNKLSTGVRHVVVNGRQVLDDGEFTGKRPGRVLRGPGYRKKNAPHSVAGGKPDERFASFDKMLTKFLKTHRVPGVAVAVTDQGRLAFSRGYGYADVAAREPVKPDSLFRIASISKPITAVAILQLIEQDRLTLDSKVLDVLDGEDESIADQLKAAGDDFDARWREITIRHLLEHRGGWDRSQSFDAMFQPVRFAKQLEVDAPADARQVIRAMFSHPLDFAPGERYAYSNFGYCLLGRVIEALTDVTYEQYVRQHVLGPLGITDMQIGSTRLSHRAKNEVRYYHHETGKSVFQNDLDEPVPSPYGAWHLEAMDSHGAWIASAVDLARFAAAFDDPDNCPLLKRTSIDLMHARPPGAAGFDDDGEPKDVYYSLGWINRVQPDGNINHWHTGSLPGTATILIRRHDGKNLIALMNARVSPASSHLGREIDILLHKAANAVTDWPQDDRFAEFFSE